ncbi:MAG: flippase-like domain-containing protein [Candidatus Eremiobacteraeota bacterium]|nr:flippase-like domain-containing protein [Candidatus Eremiobacteraeota bacterium]
MKKVALIIKIVISITLIYIVARRIDFSHFSEAWHKINIWYMLGAYILLIISMIVNSIKWWELLKVQGIKKPLKNITSHYLVGYFFNNFLTGAGEVKRIYDLSKETGKSHGVVASVFMERWTGIICQVTMAVIALGWAYKEIPELHTVLIVCGSLFLILLVIFLIAGKVSYIPFIDRFKPLHQWLETFRESYDEYMKKPGALVLAFALSLVPPIMLIFIHWLITLGLGYDVSLWVFVLFIPIISVFSQIPVSMNGIGVQEILFVELFKMVGVPPQIAFSVSILSHILKMAVGAIGGIIYLLRKEHGQLTQNEEDAKKSDVKVGKTGKVFES